MVGLIALWLGGYAFGDLLKGTRSRAVVSPTTVPAEPAPEPSVSPRHARRPRLVPRRPARGRGGLAAAWPARCAPLPRPRLGRAKTIGILAVAWLVWLVCMLTPIPFTRLTLLVALLASRRRHGWRRGACPDHQAPIAWLRACWRPLLAWEAVFLAVFLGCSPCCARTHPPSGHREAHGHGLPQRLRRRPAPAHPGHLAVRLRRSLLLLRLLRLRLPGQAQRRVGRPSPTTWPPPPCRRWRRIGLAGLAWNLARVAGVRAAWRRSAPCWPRCSALSSGNLRDLLRAARRARLAHRRRRRRARHQELRRRHHSPASGRPPMALGGSPPRASCPTPSPTASTSFRSSPPTWPTCTRTSWRCPSRLLALSCAAVHVLTRGATLRSPWTQGLAALSLGSLLVLNTWDIAPFWLLYVGLSLRQRLLLRAALSAWLACWRRRSSARCWSAPYFIGYRGPPLGLGIVTGRPHAAWLAAGAVRAAAAAAGRARAGRALVHRRSPRLAGRRRRRASLGLVLAVARRADARPADWCSCCCSCPGRTCSTASTPAACDAARGRLRSRVGDAARRRGDLSGRRLPFAHEHGLQVRRERLAADRAGPGAASAWSLASPPLRAARALAGRSGACACVCARRRAGLSDLAPSQPAGRAAARRTDAGRRRLPQRRRRGRDRLARVAERGAARGRSPRPSAASTSGRRAHGDLLGRRHGARLARPRAAVARPAARAGHAPGRPSTSSVPRRQPRRTCAHHCDRTASSTSSSATSSASSTATASTPPSAAPSPSPTAPAALHLRPTSR